MFTKMLETSGAGAERGLGEILALGPRTWVGGCLLLAFLFLLNDLCRTALMTEGTRSRIVHVLVCALTLGPAVVLAGVLLWAGASHPDRVWINLGLAAALYVFWWAGGALTRLTRKDSEGADIGWMTMGALITFPAGLVAALVFG